MNIDSTYECADGETFQGRVLLLLLLAAQRKERNDLDKDGRKKKLRKKRSRNRARERAPVPRPDLLSPIHHHHHHHACRTMAISRTCSPHNLIRSSNDNVINNCLDLVILFIWVPKTFPPRPPSTQSIKWSGM